MNPFISQKSKNKSNKSLPEVLSSFLSTSFSWLRNDSIAGHFPSLVSTRCKTFWTLLHKMACQMQNSLAWVRARRSFAYKRALAPGIYCCLCNVYYYKALLLRARAQNFCSVSTLRRFSALSQDVEGSKVSGHDMSNICFDQKLPLSYFRIFRVGKMAWHLRVIFDHKVMSRSCQEIPI